MCSTHSYQHKYCRTVKAASMQLFEGYAASCIRKDLLSLPWIVDLVQEASCQVSSNAPCSIAYLALPRNALHWQTAFIP